MKKKGKIIISIIVVLFIGITAFYFLNIDLYLKNLWAKDYYKEQYNEILHITSAADKKQAEEIMQRVDEAFSFIGTKEEAEEKFGSLYRYCVYDSQASTQEHNVDFVSADFEADKGYLWFEYSHEAFDENGDTVQGSWDCLARVELEKAEDEWIITDIKEHP